MPRAPRNDLRRAVARSRARWLWQPDKWARLLTVADLVGAAPGDTVADVGGRGRELAGLLLEAQVTSVNVEQPCDVLVVAGGPLPFADGEVDRVTSTDVLEHLPAGARTSHLGELLRVARTRVVLCFPAGSATKDASEQRLADQLRERHDVLPDFLAEHLLHGLPRADDVVGAARALAPGAEVHVLYQDGLAQTERLLLDAFDAVRGRQPAAVARSAAAWCVRRHPRLTTRVSPENNRAYVVIDLEPAAPRPPRRPRRRASPSS